MREITLHPGESLTIDGLTVKCAHKPAACHGLDVTTLCSARANHQAESRPYGAYDPVTGQFIPEKPPTDIMLNVEDIDAIRRAAIDWLTAGDLSQADLLRGAIREVALFLATSETDEYSPSGAESDHSERFQERGKPQ